MKKIMIPALIFSTLVIGIIYMIFNQIKPTISQSQDQDTISQIMNDSLTQDPIMEGTVYKDVQGVYSFSFPSGYTLDNQDPQHIRVYKRSEAQRTQSEISNGVLIIFEIVDLKNQTLDQLVDMRIQQTTSASNSELTQPKKKILLNNYPGFNYETEGFGSATNLAVQKDTQSDFAVIISSSVNDPQQIGYQAELDSILSTLVLNK